MQCKGPKGIIEATRCSERFGGQRRAGPHTWPRVRLTINPPSLSSPPHFPAFLPALLPSLPQPPLHQEQQWRRKERTKRSEQPPVPPCKPALLPPGHSWVVGSWESDSGFLAAGCNHPWCLQRYPSSFCAANCVVYVRFFAFYPVDFRLFLGLSTSLPFSRRRIWGSIEIGVPDEAPRCVVKTWQSW